MYRRFGMRYCEIRPVAGLRGIVHCLWLLEGEGAGVAPEAVLPDGRPELVLHFGDPFERVTVDGSVALQPSLLFAGQLTSQLLLRATGRVAVVGVRLHPHGAAALIRLPQHELAGATIHLGDLAGGLARDLAAIAPGDLRLAAEEVQRVLLARVRFDRLDRRVAFAVSAITRTRGQISMEAISRGANITRRHLERRFLADVGMTPKRLARISRFQHALSLLERPRATGSGVHAAMACGYADQPHFIRDFRLLAGCSPSEHRLRQAELTGFFIERSGQPT